MKKMSPSGCTKIFRNCTAQHNNFAQHNAGTLKLKDTSLEFSNFAHAVVQSHPQCRFLITSALVNRFVTSVKSCFVSQTIVHLVDLCFFQFLQFKYVFNCMLLAYRTVCKASCPMLLTTVFNVFCYQFLAKIISIKNKSDFDV